MTTRVHWTSERMADGRAVSLFHIAAAGGIAVTVAELGATLMRIDAPDRAGRIANVILARDEIAAYPAAGGPGGDACLGGSCGRVANRIAVAGLTIDGTPVRLVANEGGNQLHGGPDGFHRRLWRGEPLADGVRLALRSPDRDQGWPGVLDASAAFRLIAPDTLSIVYTATTDRATHVNLVSHPYFNLDGDGQGTILDHQLAIASDRFLPIDDGALPTGELRDVAGTPFDFRSPRTIRDAMRTPDPQLPGELGYNHCYVLPGGDLHDVARLASPRSGRWMTLATDQPGLQFYDGYGLPAAGFGPRAGLCLEAQSWPDSANRPDFPSTRLDPGQTYRSELRLRFGVDG